MILNNHKLYKGFLMISGISSRASHILFFGKLVVRLEHQAVPE